MWFNQIYHWIRFFSLQDSFLKQIYDFIDIIIINLHIVRWKKKPLVINNKPNLTYQCIQKPYVTRWQCEAYLLLETIKHNHIC